MYKIYRPKKDATIFGYDQTKNAGIGQIIELNTKKPVGESNYEPSRILIDFPEVNENFNSIIGESKNVFAAFGYELADNIDGTSPNDPVEDPLNVTLEDALESSANGMPNSFAFFGERTAVKREEKEEPNPAPQVTKNSSTAWIRLWFANGQGLPKKYEIQAFPLSKPWNEGRGRASNVPKTTSGVNWRQAKENFDWKNSGGDFSLTPRSSQKFNNDDPDVFMDASAVFSDSLENGILIKRKNEELDRETELKFFSFQTQTIYVPQLLVGKDSYQYEPQGVQKFEGKDFDVFVSDLQNSYRPTTTRFEVTVKERYKQRDFLGVRPTSDNIENQRRLPKRSLTYKIEDHRSGDTLFPFDKRYSAVSFVGGKHFFDVNLQNLFPKRPYRILFKYTDPETGNEKIFDNNQTFKIDD